MNDSDVIWVNLKVLSKLEPFQKLNTRRTHFQLQASTNVYLPEFVLRWWIGSNRESDFNRLKELYIAAEKILQTNEKDRMIVHLKDSIKGLESLQKTYETDATTKAKIDWLVDSVNQTISNNTIVSTDDVNVFQ
tara:strand:+ start:155 stop:556 length:402 start_codon:yes stop_codon:yes gene_type:complete